MTSGNFTLETKHGLISLTDTNLKNNAPTLLLIHGNSSSSKIWKNIFANEKLTKNWRIIAFDLPGHGASSDAPNPKMTYWMRGYAELAKEILEHLCIEKVVVLGWSLGGHVGIELLALLPPGIVKGLMIVGTPPCLGKEQISRGLKVEVRVEREESHMSFIGKQNLTDEELVEFAKRVAGEPYEGFMEEDVRRCDGKSRFLMCQAFTGGVGVDQRKVCEENGDALIAVVNGGDEPFINLDYIDEIKFKRLWKGRQIRMEGLLHAPFWEKPEEFAEILFEFMKDCENV